MSVNTGNTDAECIIFDETYGVPFPCISGIEGGGNAINSTYGINAYPTYILIAPDHSIVEQDMWPISSTQTFVDYFESNGLEQSDCNPFSADFIADATDICEYDVVNYTDLSSGDITSWNWVFEGGDPATSTEQNPVILYNDEGEYDVELTISNGTETSTTTLENYIVVAMSPPVMLNPFNDVCEGDPAFELTGGSPTGGVYSGPGVTDGWFDPAVAGLGTHTITYTYTGLNGCDNSTDQTILVDPCTGINELGAGKISIYPNPSRGEFDLKINHNGAVSVKVVNIIGVTIYNEQITALGEIVTTIDLHGFEEGIYFVTIQTEEKSYVKKLRLLK